MRQVGHLPEVQFCVYWSIKVYENPFSGRRLSYAGWQPGGWTDWRDEVHNRFSRFFESARSRKTRKWTPFTDIHFKIIFKETKTLTKSPPPNKLLSKFHPVEFVLAQNNSSTYDTIITDLSQYNYTTNIQLHVWNVCYMFRSRPWSCRTGLHILINPNDFYLHGSIGTTVTRFVSPDGAT